MKHLYPKVIDTKVNIDNRGYLIETFKKKKINTDFKYSILVSSKKNVFRGLVNVNNFKRVKKCLRQCFLLYEFKFLPYLM